MQYKLIFTETFDRDTAEICAYIANELFDETAALRLYEKIHDTFLTIARFPRMYPVYSGEAMAVKGYRFFPAGNYLVFYSIDEERQTVYAQAMVYGMIDMSNM